MNTFSVLAILSVAFLALAIAGPVDQQKILVGESNPSPSLMQVLTGGGKTAATCYDSNLARFINNGLQYYSNDMGQLANYILNQIKVAGYSAYWLVHAQMIAGQRQPVQWDSVATGDIFNPSSRHGCYYHDGKTYIVILQY